MADALAYYAKKEYGVELECVRIFMYSTILAISSIKFKYSKSYNNKNTLITLFLIHIY